MFPEFNDETAKAAGWLTALGGILAGLWKIRLWLRADAREDRAGERGDDAGELAQDVWERTVARLQGQIDRMEREAQDMAERMAAVQKELSVQVELRYEAQGDARRAEYRLQAMEDELARLKAGMVPARPAG